MKVKALVSFAGEAGTHAAGDEFELPEGVDWLRAGLVAPVEPEPEPEASAEPKPARKKKEK